jgi:hypothetical protein
MLMWFSIRLVMLFVVANSSVLIAVDYVTRFPRWLIRYFVNYDYFLLLVLVSSIYALLSRNLSYNIVGIILATSLHIPFQVPATLVPE